MRKTPQLSPALTFGGDERDLLPPPASDRAILRWQISPCERVEFVQASMGVCGLPDHFHDVWSVGLILQGSCCFTAANQSHQAPTGSIFILPPYELHACRAGSVDVRYAVLYVDDGAMRAQAPSLCARVLALAQRVWHAHDIRADALGGPPAPPTLLDAAAQITSAGAALDWLAALDYALALLPVALPRPGKPGLHPLQHWFHAHWGQYKGLAEAASAIPRSRSQVIRSFRLATGLTPGAYLRQLRVQKSRRWLGREGLSLADVALRLGFADQAHFTREFKRVFGITPGRFGAVLSHGAASIPTSSAP